MMVAQREELNTPLDEFRREQEIRMKAAPTPFHPLVSYLQKRHFHPEGYRLHPFSSSCLISSKTTFSPERVTGYPFSSSCFISSKTTFSPRRLPAPPLFILLFHIFKNGIFTERVTGSTRFHPLVSPRGLYRLHPLVSYLQKHSKTAFSPRGLPAPPLFIVLFHIFKNDILTERVTGSTPFSSSCFISSKTTFSPRGLPAPPLFILLFHSFKNGTFTERVAGSTPFHPLVSYLQKRHCHREGYRLHPFSSPCFRTTFSPTGLPAPPLFILLLHIFKNDIFTEMATGSTPFHPLVSYLQKWHFHREGYRLHPLSSCLIYLQKRHFHREGYRLHPFSSSCFISIKTAFHMFSPRGCKPQRQL